MTQIRSVDSFLTAAEQGGSIVLEDKTPGATIVRSGFRAWVRSFLGIGDQMHLNARTHDTFKKALLHDPRYAHAHDAIEAMFSGIHKFWPLTAKEVRSLTSKALVAETEAQCRPMLGMTPETREKFMELVTTRFAPLWQPTEEGLAALQAALLESLVPLCIERAGNPDCSPMDQDLVLRILDQAFKNMTAQLRQGGVNPQLTPNIIRAALADMPGLVKKAHMAEKDERLTLIALNTPGNPLQRGLAALAKEFKPGDPAQYDLIKGVMGWLKTYPPIVNYQGYGQRPLPPEVLNEALERCLDYYRNLLAVLNDPRVHVPPVLRTHAWNAVLHRDGMLDAGHLERTKQDIDQLATGDTAGKLRMFRELGELSLPDVLDEARPMAVVTYDHAVGMYNRTMKRDMPRDVNLTAFNKVFDASAKRALKSRAVRAIIPDILNGTITAWDKRAILRSVLPPLTMGLVETLLKGNLQDYAAFMKRMQQGSVDAHT